MNIGDLTLGMVIGAVVGFIFGMAIMFNDYHSANTALERCELTIPRDQTCVITAVIEESGE